MSRASAREPLFFGQLTDRLGRKKLSMSHYQVRRIERHPLIDARVHTQVRAVHGHAGTLIAVTIAGADGRPERRAARALFLCIGGHPHTGWTAAAGVQTDSVSYISTGPDLLAAAERPADWPPRRPTSARSTSRWPTRSSAWS